MVFQNAECKQKDYRPSPAISTMKKHSCITEYENKKNCIKTKKKPEIFIFHLKKFKFKIFMFSGIILLYTIYNIDTNDLTQLVQVMILVLFWSMKNSSTTKEKYKTIHTQKNIIALN